MEGRRATTPWWWPLGLVVIIAVLLIATQVRVDPLDDPDPAYQRPGLLDLGPLPIRAPAVEDRSYADSPTLLVFERASRPPCAWLDAPEVNAAAIVVALGAPDGATGPAVCAGAVHVGDPWALARRVGMRTPHDGGFPVGYAIVDGEGRLRYRTLDPDMAHLLGEIGTMIDAVARS